MCEDHKKEQYQHPCEQPGKVRPTDRITDRFSPIKMLIQQALFLDSSKREFYDYVNKREQERRLYGGEDGEVI